MRKTTAAAAALALLTSCGKFEDADAMPPSGIGPITKLADVTDVRCGADDRGVRAEGVLTNKSDSPHMFVMVVVYRGRDGLPYMADAVPTADLPPGAVATWESSPNTPAMPRGTCDVVVVYPVPRPELDPPESIEENS